MSNCCWNSASGGVADLRLTRHFSINKDVNLVGLEQCSNARSRMIMMRNWGKDYSQLPVDSGSVLDRGSHVRFCG